MFRNDNRLRFVTVGLSALTGVLLWCLLQYQGGSGDAGTMASAPGGHTAYGLASPAAPHQEGQTASSVKKPGPAAALPDAEPLLSATAVDYVPDLPLPGTSPFTGNFTDLSPDEEERARDIFIAERAKWGKLTGLSGELSLHFVDTVTGLDESVTCQVDIGPPPPESNRNPAGRLLFYEIALKDKEGKWSAVIHGKGKPQIQCEDAALGATIMRCILWGGILELFDMPRRTLSELDLRDDVSGGHLGSERFFQLRQALHSRVEGYNDARDSYMFEWARDPQKGDVLAFREGRFCYWTDRGSLQRRRARVYYKDYEQIDGFDFPTSIEGHFLSYVMEMKFSKCKIATLP